MYCNKCTREAFLYGVVYFLLVGSLQVAEQAPADAWVESFPGYIGSQPYNIYTGYITVNETRGRALFYYFVESERNPSEDPVLLWLTGGPGCSSFTGFVYEIGPMYFDLNYTGGLPKLIDNPHSWTKVCNIIFLDSPAGTGFSYSNSTEDYVTGDFKTVSDAYTFLMKWFEAYPEFLSNPLYIGGDSYSGYIVPMLTQKIADETYESFDKENHLIDSGSKLLRKKSLKVVVSEEDKYSVKRNKNTVKYDVIRSMKELRESKKQIQSGSCLVEAKLTQLLCSATKESGGQDQTNSHFDSAGDTVHQRIDKNGTEQSPAENEHLDQMKSNCCKTGKLISSDKSQTKRYRTSKSSQASRYEICGKITDETVIELSNVTCLEDITSAREKCKKYNLFPSDPDSGLISNETTSNEEDGKE
ncbi:serine carboxypeptidase-like 17 [Cryptomeria japonica]|uniref:serine carboxypeptidase-like 17 n=1 Tax=Cryptomeria japonica TaxID=3369 RepID=UPI0027DA662D|nr:serine carboxypeptidase-like 17 [Cryptomeria japonica]